MDEMQAAFLSIKLKHLDAENRIRQQIADYYLANIKNEKIILPTRASHEDSHTWHLFIIRTKERDKMQTYLTENGVQTLIHYPIPPHKQECYKEWNSQLYPITEKIHNEVLSLPISPVMTEEEVKKIAKIINLF
jgi:dTDP-4-amino-4,6-dideoxygalactose transaminase